MASAHLDAVHFIFSLCASGAFEAATPVLEHIQSESEEVCLCGFIKRNFLRLQNFFHRLNPLWFLQSEVVGTYIPSTGTLGWGAWYGAVTPRSRDIPPNFFPPHAGMGPAHSTSAPFLPVWMDVVSLIL